MPPQTPFLSKTSGGVSPSHRFFVGVEVGWHLIALIHIDYKEHPELGSQLQQKSCQILLKNLEVIEIQTVSLNMRIAYLNYMTFFSSYGAIFWQGFKYGSSPI